MPNGATAVGDTREQHRQDGDDVRLEEAAERLAQALERVQSALACVRRLLALSLALHGSLQRGHHTVLLERGDAKPLDDAREAKRGTAPFRIRGRGCERLLQRG